MYIKEIVNFFRYRQGVMYCAVKVSGLDKVHMFPVPVGGVGDATDSAHCQQWVKSGTMG